MSQAGLADFLKYPDFAAASTFVLGALAFQSFTSSAPQIYRHAKGKWPNGTTAINAENLVEKGRISPEPADSTSTSTDNWQVALLGCQIILVTYSLSAFGSLLAFAGDAKACGFLAAWSQLSLNTAKSGFLVYLSLHLYDLLQPSLIETLLTGMALAVHLPLILSLAALNKGSLVQLPAPLSPSSQICQVKHSQIPGALYSTIYLASLLYGTGRYLYHRWVTGSLAKSADLQNVISLSWTIKVASLFIWTIADFPAYLGQGNLAARFIPSTLTALCVVSIFNRPVVVSTSNFHRSSDTRSIHSVSKSISSDTSHPESLESYEIHHSVVHRKSRTGPEMKAKFIPVIATEGLPPTPVIKPGAWTEKQKILGARLKIDTKDLGEVREEDMSPFSTGRTSPVSNGQLSAANSPV